MPCMVRMRRSFPDVVTPKISRSIPSRAAVNQTSRPPGPQARPWTVDHPAASSVFFPVAASTIAIAPSSPFAGWSMKAICVQAGEKRGPWIQPAVS